jgi:hypothetical protein
MHIPKQRFIKKLNNGVRAGAIVALVAIIGVSLAFISHAASPYVSGYASQGTVSGTTNSITGGSNPTGTAVQFGTSATASNFITTSGTNLMWNGRVFQFVGFDAYGMEGCYSGDPWTTAQLDAYFASLPTDSMTRIWAEQSFGTSALSNIVAQATKYNQHLVLSLSDEDGTCDPNTDNGNGSTGDSLQFYQSDWQTILVPWINTVVPMFANDPAVAMWEIGNEPGLEASVPEATMQSYLTGVAEAIKAKAPNQLVESGVGYTYNTNSENGTEATYQEVQSSPDINVLDIHDYIEDNDGNGTILSPDYTTAQEAAKALNKPFIVGEAGVEVSTDGTSCQMTSQQQRLTYLLTDKTTDYFEGIGPNGTGSPAMSGIMYWDAEPFQASWVGSCTWEIYPTDILVPAVQSYVIP